MSISACLIVYNEADLIARAMNYLLGVKEINEICILDSFSTDGTWEILGGYAFAHPRKFKIAQRKFTTFGDQRNAVMDMATQEWIVSMDGDETYSRDFGRMLEIECKRNDINGIRVPTIVLFGDETHYLNTGNGDPHVRVWRREGSRHSGVIHELLTDSRGRVLHTCRDADILNSWVKYPNVWMKHAQLLKSRESLLDKGKRWTELDVIAESHKKGIPIYEGIWAVWKESANERWPVVEVPPQWR